MAIESAIGDRTNETEAAEQDVAPIKTPSSPIEQPEVVKELTTRKNTKEIQSHTALDEVEFSSQDQEGGDKIMVEEMDFFGDDF